MFIVIGSATVDLLISGIPRMPSLEGDEFTTSSLVFCDDPLVISPGGNGCNTAYALARLGASAALCSAIGDDELGDLMWRWVTDAGVDVSGLKRSPYEATSSTTVLMTAPGSRLSFHHLGATGGYVPEDVPPGLLDQAAVILVCAYTLLKGWRPEGFADVLARAKAHGLVTALDVGPAVDPPASLSELRDTATHLDFLIANEHELAVLTGTKHVGESMRRVLDAGAACVILKRGEHGASFQRNTDADVTTVAGIAVEPRGTVGAGDTFNAGLLFALHAGRHLEDAVRFANVAAACVVASENGVSDCPTESEVRTLLRADVQ